jgi:hypothetical protein
VNLRAPPRQFVRFVTKGQMPTAIQEEEEDLAEAEEGQILTRLHLGRERSHCLIEKKRASALKVYRRLQCQGRSVDFEATYGRTDRASLRLNTPSPCTDFTGRQNSACGFSAALFQLSSYEPRTPSMVDRSRPQADYSQIENRCHSLDFNLNYDRV